MTRIRTHATLVIASTLVAACASGGGGNGASGPAGYPASYSSQQADLQELAASRYDQQSIMQAQRALGERGYDVGAIDGIWGPSSQSALRNFQQVNGMKADGRLEPEVLAALDVSSAPGAQAQGRNRDGTAATRAQTQQRPDDRQPSMADGRQREGLRQPATSEGAASGDRDLEAFYDARTLLEVQRALADRGFEVGRVDGVWGPESQRALRDFQHDQGLETSGRINERTLAALDVAAGAGERPEGTAR